ncbi:MAG: phytanoyl-CoA dioxygenase family protein [Bacteroidota bacterium]|nr:phytanoyl-CoA dioxygenase family protein [Bacteroidota bacterium]
MRALLYRLRQKIKTRAKNKKIFVQAYAAFKKTGTTSTEGYTALLDLYCSSNGKFNEKIHKEIIVSNPPKKITDSVNGIIGKISPADFTNINTILNKDGYYNFDKKINPELVSKIYNYALKANTVTAPLYDKKIVFDPKNPISEIYRFEQNDLINNTDIQQLIMDPVLINVARNYLGCEPIFDFPAMWWSTTFLKEASSEAAQLYHFDLDRIKWLKIFIYLNDVTSENGPHRLIKSSHLPGAKPQELLNRGYARIPDEDILKHYKPDDFLVVIGDAGSMFAEDTKCWHKGTPLKSGNRLVLEFEYTSSLFGANYPKFEVKNISDEFKQFCINNPIYASNFTFKN